MREYIEMVRKADDLTEEKPRVEAMKKRVFICLLTFVMVLIAGCSAGPDTEANEIKEAKEKTELPVIRITDEEAADNNEPEEEIEENTEEDAVKKEDIVILHTNDVHCGVDMNIGYAGVSAYKKQVEAEGKPVFLIDVGDEINGGFMGDITKGESIIRVMNEMGYNLAVPGNHEFDYGVDNFFRLTEMADFPYICCNFIDLKTGEPALEPYRIEEIGGWRIAFVGVTSPNVILNDKKKTFKNKDGENVYSFMEGEDGGSMYKTIQESVDAARAEGVDYCILLSHLGTKPEESPYTVYETVENTRGIDIVLDAHSHVIIDAEKVKNADGKEISVTQCGYFVQALGKLTIDENGNMESTLIQEYDEKDEAIIAALERETRFYEEILSKGGR